MSSNNDGKGDNTSYALTIFEQKALEETRSFTKKYENKIIEDQKYFASKTVFGLWLDAKGLFNTSDANTVVADMEPLRKLFDELDKLIVQIEKGDTKSYQNLVKIYKEIEERVSESKYGMKNHQSKAVCKMLKEFLDKKYILDHNLKKVECIILKQKMHQVEETCKSSTDAVEKMTAQMGTYIDGNRKMREAIETMKKEKEEQALEAERRSEAFRQKSEEKLDKLIKENRDIKKIMEMERKEKEELRLEAEIRSEAIRRESDEKLKQVLKEAEERFEGRIREMKDESDQFAARIRLESDENLKKAVEEANRRSEARIQEMADQNRASLQKMAKMLETISIP